MSTAKRPPSSNLELLEQLKRDANSVIALLSNLNLDEAIKWGDLSCHKTSYVLNDDGSYCWRVLIKEAAPDAEKFRTAILTALEYRYWNNVEVITEW